MRKEVERRLAAIESRLNPAARTIQETIIRGGFASGIAPIATFGDHQWEAEPNESFEAFRARAKAAAEAEGAQLIVFGGLPEPELIASEYVHRHHAWLCDPSNTGHGPEQRRLLDEPFG